MTIMQDHELDAWLGDNTVTEPQRAALHAASDIIDARYPDPDLASSREAAFSGAAQVVLGDSTLESMAAEWRAARAAERQWMESLTGAIIAESAATSELQIAERTGLNRITVRKALGK